MSCAIPDEDNRAAQEDELVVLRAIYGDDLLLKEARACEIHVPSASAEPKLILHVELSDAYPSHRAPSLALLQAPHLDAELQRWVVLQLQELFQPGEVVLHAWVEWLKEQQHLWEAPVPASARCGPEGLEHDEQHESSEADADTCTSAQAAQSTPLQCNTEAEDALASGAAVAASIVHGEPFVERKSTFQGHLAPVTSVQAAADVVATLLQNGKIQKATHNIMAYRIRAGEGNFLQDFDDDGESAAGGRLLHLLQVAGAENVVVVVSRWFGGVLLGPARFTHINNAARQLLEAQGFIQRGGSKAPGSRRKAAR